MNSATAVFTSSLFNIMVMVVASYRPPQIYTSTPVECMLLFETHFGFRISDFSLRKLVSGYWRLVTG